MKAKWLWTTWATLALLGVIVLDLFFIGFTVRLQLPKLQKLTAEGWLRLDDRSEPAVSWMYSILTTASRAWEEVVWVLLIVAAGWGLFEWRVRNENKTFIRLSGLGTLAAGLTLVVVLVAMSSMIPYTLGLPGSRIARPWAVETITSVDTSVSELEAALAKKDWDAVRASLNRAEQALNRLDAGPVPGTLASWNELPSGPQIRTSLDGAKVNLTNARSAVQNKDAVMLEGYLQSFRTAFGPILTAAKRVDQ